MAKIHRPANNTAAPAEGPMRRATKAASHVSIYANDVQLYTSFWDMRLELGEIGAFPTSPDQPAEVTVLADLRISLPLAKKLAELIEQQIQLFEKTVGYSIPVPTLGKQNT